MDRSAMMVTALALLAATSARADKPDRQGQAAVGSPMPRVASIGLDPHTAESSERLLKQPGTRGLVVLFFATWCKPCAEEIDQVVRERARLDKAGVRVLLVSLMDDTSKLARFVQEHRLEGLPLIRDISGAIVEQFNLEDPKTKSLTLPVSFVADREGVVRAILRGNGGDYVQRVLDALQ